MEGYHLGAVGRKAELIKRIHRGDGCLQLFVAGPSNYKAIKFRPEEINLLNSFNVYVHSAYVTYPWSGNKLSFIQINRELTMADSLGAKAYIIHLPKNTVGMMPIFRRLAKIAQIHHTRIAFETVATADNSPQALVPIVRKIRELGGRLCIDTAHLWASGIDVSRYSVFKQWLAHFGRMVIVCHLNDSRAEFGSGIDRHAPVCTGKIWKGREGEYKKIRNLLKRLKIDSVHEY